MTNWISLAGKRVVITGGSSGIGSIIVKQMLASGAKVSCLDVKPSEYEGQYFFFECDISDQNRVNAAINSAAEKMVGIDVLINDAAINSPKMIYDFYGEEAGHQYDDRDFDRHFDINVKGVLHCVQAVMPHLLSNNGGTIINMSSEAGSEGSVGQALYSATKGAVNALTFSIAKELGPKNIRAVAVAPGINEPTPMGNSQHVADLGYTRGDFKQSREKQAEKYLSNIPLRRVGRLSEIADLIIYLASDHSSYISGTVVNITGGKSHG